VIQSQFPGIPDEEIKQLIPKEFFAGPRGEQANVQGTPFGVCGGRVCACNISPVVNPQESCLWEIGMHNCP
jgi:hypothetical protein